MFENLTSAQRMELAKDKMEKVLGHLLYVLELHANNVFVVYSPALSAQIPPSYAASAFNVFRQSMHQIEIVRLCALWDSADAEKDNIPTIIKLIDDHVIVETLADEPRRFWPDSGGGGLFNPSDDPAVKSIEQDALRTSNIQFGNDQAEKAKTELDQAITDAGAILGTTRLKAVMNLRDKHLAHNLSSTRREKHGPVDPVKYGDETALLNETIPIVERLFCWITGKSFTIADSQEIDRENAASLWNGCKFSGLR